MVDLWTSYGQSEALQTVSSLLDQHKSLVTDTTRRLKAQQALLSKLC